MIISSHMLDELERISDVILLLHEGMIEVHGGAMSRPRRL